MKRQYISIPFVVALAIALGCEKKGPTVPDDLTPVQGVATIDGKPLAGVAVTFCSETEGGPSAAGVTDQSGRFQLTSFPIGNGARPGKYKVIVVSRAVGGYSPQSANQTPAATATIPATYGIPATTSLSATVPATGDIVLELKSRP
jgi:hypothetical protein